MKRYISLILLTLGWVHECQSSSHDQNVSEVNSVRGEKYCTHEGLMCKDCTKLVECVQDANGFTEVLVQECNTTKEEYCFRNKRCDTTFNTHCTPDYEFKCTATAFFPDPVDCRIYHICVQEKDTYRHHVFTCNEPYFYSIISTYCNAELDENRCPDNLPVPECDFVGQTGATRNKSIWFKCLLDKNNRLISELYLCPNGQLYNGTTCEEYIWP